jgi:predicted GIY-YIG superfamily endonuclease
LPNPRSSFGLASQPRAKAVTPKRWGEGRRPDHREGGPPRFAPSLMAGHATESSGVPSDQSSGSKSRGTKTVPPTPFAYILRCADGTFYVGHTGDIASREKVHNDGFGSRHAAARSPVHVVYAEICRSLRAAVCRKRQLKTWGERKLEP